MDFSKLPAHMRSNETFLFHELRQQAYLQISVSEDLRQKLNTTLERLLPMAEESIGLDRKFYRARIHSFEQKESYKREEMGAPPKSKTSRVRIQLENHQVLYTANNVETAVAEVRPTQGSQLSIATFLPQKQNMLRVFNFAQNLNPKLPGSSNEFSNFYQDVERFLSANRFSDRHFSKQTHPNDPSKYLDTIFIAQVIQEKGFDGIAYKSLLNSGGLNYAFFSPEKLVCTTDTEIRTITSVVVKSEAVSQS